MKCACESCANFRENSRKMVKRFEKLNRPQNVCWSHFRHDTRNLANLGKSRFFTFAGSQLWIPNDIGLVDTFVDLGWNDIASSMSYEEL